MRAFILLLALATAGPVAAPVAAQDYLSMVLARDAERTAEALAARNRDIALTNELAVLQARLQSEQALSNLQASRISPTLPTVVVGSGAQRPKIEVSKLATIPDAVLADSNARVRAAAENRR